ncbi:DUF4833 domain-containing protein [Shimia isoporae]|uniref:DUF4833 domain-containing protein n=1 Tax=Shimia isoporae TaxID=647720 RepID=UPI0014054CBD|nr:DUF4833 domain-containing protein [Shimia isoporae]
MAAIVVLAVALPIIPPAAHAKPRLTLVSSTPSVTLPVAENKFRHPADLHQVFFLQRTTNANTIVYVAQFDENGTLDSSQPIVGYWRRFAGAGHIMEFRWYERVFGFGARTRLLSAREGYEVRFNGIRDQKLILRQEGPFQAALYKQQNGQDFKMIYGFLDIDDSGLLPKVTRLRLYTSDPNTGRYMTHTIAVSGGAFRE